jgi:hypothetical protein
MPWIDMDFNAIGKTLSQREIRQVDEIARRNSKPRFYADENFPVRATAILREYKANVLTVQEARRTGHPDGNHTAESLRLRRILITCDRDYLDERRFPLISCPALVVCDFGGGSDREIRETFTCLWMFFVAPQLHDKWIKIDARLDCWTEYVRYLDGTTTRTRCRFYGGRAQEWVD